MVGLIVYLEWYGIGMIFGYIVFMAIYRLFLNPAVWDFYIQVKKSIETVIWGKPLKHFEKGELKNHKVEIVWRKENGNKTNNNGETSKKC